MMEPNSTMLLPPFFYLESLGIPPSRTNLFIILATLAYCFIVVGNMTLILSITLNRSLHKPMFLLLLNQPVNDLMGATAFYPHLIRSIALEDRSISCAACLLQTLLLHLYGGGTFIILTGMAYDRFLAICCPLRYSTLMSHANLMKIILAMWLLDLVLISSLIFLLSPFKFCGNSLPSMSCNNASLVKLVCGDTRINNYYGLFLNFFLQGMSQLAVIFTYTQILVACLTNKQSDTKSKALRTCSTHLTVFLMLQSTSVFLVLSQRSNQVSVYVRRTAAGSLFMFPPIFNPLIYGLNSKEIRSVVIHYFTKKNVTSLKGAMCRIKWLLMVKTQIATKWIPIQSPLHRRVNGALCRQNGFIYLKQGVS